MKPNPGAAAQVKGFTLLEILIAMAIFAVMAVSVTTATQRSILYAGRLEEKSVAHWVAMNKMAVLQSQVNWPSLGKKDEQVEMGNREWTVTTEVQASQVPDFRLVAVSVGQKEAGLGGEVRVSSRLTALLADKTMDNP